MDNIFGNLKSVNCAKCKVTGQIPSWLTGDFIRNGPGEFQCGKEKFHHWFDGHALLNKFSISNGEASYSSRFIDSVAYRDNHKSMRIVHGTFGSKSVPDPCKNIFSKFFTEYTSSPALDNANVNTLKLGDVFYAITDTPTAYKFDIHTLKNDESPCRLNEVAGMLLTAHPHVDSNGDYYNIGTRFGRQADYTIIKVNHSDIKGENPLGKAKCVGTVHAEDTWNPAYFHSFALTEDYLVLHEQSLRISVTKLLTPGFLWKGFLHSLHEDETKNSIFHVVNKKTGIQIPISFSAKSRFCFHHANAYQHTENGKRYIVMDMISSEKSTMHDLVYSELMSDNSTLLNPKKRPTPQRYVLPLDINENTTKDRNLVEINGYTATAKYLNDGTVFLQPEVLFPDNFEDKFSLTGIELPRINYKYNGRQHRYIYGLGSSGHKLFSCLIKLDVTTKHILTWREEGYHPSEAVFVAKPDGDGEDDGVVLSVAVHNDLNVPSFLVVLDASSFQELGRAEVDAKPPIGFHGLFSGKL